MAEEDHNDGEDKDDMSGYMAEEDHDHGEKRMIYLVIWKRRNMMME